MNALLTPVLLCGAGVALLRLLRLDTRRLSVDLPLGWFLGQAWFGLSACALRLLLGVPYGAPMALTLVAVPPAALLLVARRRTGRPVEAVPEGAPAAEGPRWRPRPAWLFLLLGLAAALVALAVVLHALAAPIATDDALRVRAYAPVLAFRDEWSAAARAVLHMAGPIPAFVPSLAWVVTGRLDHLHTQVVVLADLVALLTLAVGLGAARGGRSAASLAPSWSARCPSSRTT